MNEKEDVNINLFDLKFLIEKASYYIGNLKDEHYSMKLWEDRIEEIKSKSNFDELMIGRNNYAYELKYLKDIIINIYQKHPKITFSKVRELLVKEMGVHPHYLPVKTDIEHITYIMIRDGEIMGEIDERNRSFIFKGLRNEKS